MHPSWLRDVISRRGDNRRGNANPGPAWADHDAEDEGGGVAPGGTGLAAVAPPAAWVGAGAGVPAPSSAKAVPRNLRGPRLGR